MLSEKQSNIAVLYEGWHKDRWYDPSIAPYVLRWGNIKKALTHAWKATDWMPREPLIIEFDYGFPYQVILAPRKESIFYAK